MDSPKPYSARVGQLPTLVWWRDNAGTEHTPHSGFIRAVASHLRPDQLIQFFVLFFGLGAFSQYAHAESASLLVREVASGIYMHAGIAELPDRHNRGEIANLGFIVGSRCVAVLDTGGSPEQGQALKRVIAATTSTPICYVINSHVHPDHIYGNLAFKQPGVKFVGHHKLARAMAMRAPYYLQKAASETGLTLGREHFIPPDIEVEGTQDLDLGERTLRLTAHRTAHTDNDLSVFDLKTKTLWMADLLFMEHLPVVDGSLKGWIAVVDELKNLDAKRVIPGHGPVVADWPAAAESELRYLRNLQDELRTLLKAGKTLEQAMASAGLAARQDWRLFDDFHKRNVASGYAELEWEDP